MNVCCSNTICNRSLIPTLNGLTSQMLNACEIALSKLVAEELCIVFLSFKVNFDKAARNSFSLLTKLFFCMIFTLCALFDGNKSENGKFSVLAVVFLHSS